MKSLLPGLRVPDALWVFLRLSPGYSIRMDASAIYLVFGSEELVATFPGTLLLTVQKRKEIESQVRTAMRMHEAARHHSLHGELGL